MPSGSWLPDSRHGNGPESTERERRCCTSGDFGQPSSKPRAPAIPSGAAPAPTELYRHVPVPAPIEWRVLVATRDHDHVVSVGEGDEISVKRRDLIEVFCQLEFLVVSLDHIESAFRDGSEDEEAHALRRFIADWAVLSRVSEARFILDAYFPRGLGTDGMDDLERELSDMSFWSWSDPTPSLGQSGPEPREPKQ